MKPESLKISSDGRVAAFIFGVVSASVTLKQMITGVTRYGGVENTRADEPVAYCSVVLTMTYISVLQRYYFFAQRLRRGNLMPNRSPQPTRDGAFSFPTASGFTRLDPHG
jgi:hypothetical protein